MYKILNLNNYIYIPEIRVNLIWISAFDNSNINILFKLRIAIISKINRLIILYKK